MRGRKPKPTALKRREGNPGNQRLPGPGEEPQPLVSDGVPAAPSHLDALAAEAWASAAPELHRLQLLTVLDLADFERWCVLYSAWRRTAAAADEQRENAMHPVHRKLREAAKALDALGANFGMNPVARMRLHIPREPQKSPLEARLELARAAQGHDGPAPIVGLDAWRKEKSSGQVKTGGTSRRKTPKRTTTKKTSRRS